MKAFVTALLLAIGSQTMAADWVEEIFDKFDSNCAYNASGSIERFNPRRLDLAREMAKLRAENQGCEEGRVYSRSKSEGVATFLDVLSRRNSGYYAAECVSENLTPRERGMLRNLIRDRSNLAVLTSTEYSGENPEACSYYHFWVYRADGRVLKFTLNYTD